ncbi:MAG TPA: RNA 2',3'-cyclic phosphodiesterase [Candidatus Dormibacteraeota bacterium]
MRCFLAVPLADAGLAAAQRLQGALRANVTDVRWARPETLHLTVHFFGAIDDARVDAALAAVTPIANRSSPFEVVLDRLGAFPPRGTPRVLWLGPTGEIVPLSALALECRDALAAIGFEVEHRAYHPHCTLGRPRTPWRDAARAAWDSAVTAGSAQTVSRFTARRLVLFESRSARGGAVYIEHAVLQLGPV